MSYRKKYRVAVKVKEVIRQGGKADLVIIEGVKKAAWLPHRCCEPVGGSIFMIPGWMFEKITQSTSKGGEKSSESLKSRPMT